MSLVSPASPMMGFGIPCHPCAGALVSPAQPMMGIGVPCKSHDGLWHPQPALCQGIIVLISLCQGVIVPCKPRSRAPVSPASPMMGIGVPCQLRARVSLSPASTITSTGTTPTSPVLGSRWPHQPHDGPLATPASLVPGSCCPLPPPCRGVIVPGRPCAGTPLSLPTGGTLKTLEEADAESLQATWWPGDPCALPLRALDILPLLDLAARYRRSPPHPPTLPQELPCPLLCLRLLVAFANDAGDLWVLLGTAGTPHLPVVACGTSPAELRGGLRLPVLRLLRDCLPPDPHPGPLGLLGLQHQAGGPGGADGVCFNVLLSIPPSSPGAAPPEPRSPAFRWWRVEEESLRGRILQRLRAAATVPIRS
ncbi:8-oxo-dgdp phosphatase nudt18 [Limosa lapponica baueri]|uniref:8-oxo-dgdp phosphatase nudt18 n=1 Tax=Limosa lapponica baueri TaxID=1758121 RepID=A0A2I0T076_LIMLA|nr:8-oxo-dgdp phosphatase nudt18 [Limosa lapponica baueri]